MVLHRLTDNDFIDRIIEKVRCMNDDSDIPMTDQDIADEARMHRQLRYALERLDSDTLSYLYGGIITGYSSQCDCGCIHEIDPLTGHMSVIPAKPSSAPAPAPAEQFQMPVKTPHQ